MKYLPLEILLHFFASKTAEIFPMYFHEIYNRHKECIPVKECGE